MVFIECDFTAKMAFANEKKKNNRIFGIQMKLRMVRLEAHRYSRRYGKNELKDEQIINMLLRFDIDKMAKRKCSNCGT